MTSCSVEAARGLIPITRRLAYLDNAGAGPLPYPTVEAVRRYLEEWMYGGEPWEEALSLAWEARRLFARLVGAPGPEFVAIAPSASHALSTILASLRYPRGSNVVVSELNFPSSIYAAQALRRAGLVSEVRVARARGGRVPFSEYERLVDDDTAVVVVDAVAWLTGYMEDLPALSRLARERGALLVTDAFHAVGVVPVDVGAWGVDALVAGSYKWLMAPHGVAFAYASRRLLREAEPPLAGWMSSEDSPQARWARGEPTLARPFPEEYKPAPAALRFEPGTWAAAVLAGAVESLRLILEHDAPGLYGPHTSRLARAALDALEEAGLETVTPRDSMAAIASAMARDSRGLAERLAREGVAVSARPGIIRVSPHYYNTMDEIERLARALREALR